MRKFLAAVLFTAGLAGLALAGEVTLVKYDKDKKEVTVTAESVEKVYKLTDKTTFKNGDKEIKKVEAGFTRLEKMKADAKFEITADKETATEIKFAAPKDKAK